jgi:hypothetical protein
MKFAGLDFSITCPALTIYDDKTNEYEVYVWTNVKKLEGYSLIKNNGKTYFFNIDYLERKKDHYEYYFKLVDSIIHKIESKKIEALGIEQYAFGGSGKLTILAEAVGMIKRFYFKTYNKYIMEVPIQLGKMVGNSEFRGDASKYTNIQYFLKNECNFLESLHLSIRDESPVGDIVDSFNIMKSLVYLHKKINGEVLPAKLVKSLSKLME